MICNTCGTDNLATSTFCGKCGTRLAPEPAIATISEALSEVEEQPIVVPDQSPVSVEATQTSEEAPTQRLLEPGEQPALAVWETPQPSPSVGEQFVFGAYAPPGAAGLASSEQFPLQGVAGPGASGVYPPFTPQPLVGYADPNAPTSNFYPPAYFGQPSQPNWGGYPGMLPPTTPKEPSKLIRPLPLWVFIIGIIIVALVLVALTFFTGSDWAAGLQTAGFVSLLLGLLLLVAFAIRMALGLLAQTNPHRRAQIISSLLLILLLFAFSAVGLTQQAGVHNLQGRIFENQQNWQQAINEYEAAGQGAPTSLDIARTYNEWGEYFLARQNYSTGLDRFKTVISNYTQVPDQETRAENDAITSYLDLGNQASHQQDYASAIQDYDTLLGQSYCQGACNSNASSADAVSYYNLAEKQLAKKNYAASVAAFSQLTTRFSGSSSAQSAHADYAKALFGQGKQQLTSACSSAVNTYQQLAKKFSDTPQGQQAAVALKQPQSVTGTFTTSIPDGNNQPEVGLVQGTKPSMSTNAFFQVLGNSPVQNVNSNGSFTFRSIKQGKYDLVWGIVNNSAGEIVFFNGNRDGTYTFVATVGPLCAYKFGNINETFPTL